MKKKKIIYHELGIVKGHFVSDFETKKIRKNSKAVFSDINFVGRSKLENGKLIKSIPKTTDDGKVLKKDEIDFVEIYPAKGQKSPVETSKRLYVRDFKLVDPVIEDSFMDGKVRKGRISGTAYAVITRKEEIELEDPVIKEEITAIKKENVDPAIHVTEDNINEPLDKSHIIKDPVPEGGCMKKGINRAQVSGNSSGSDNVVNDTGSGDLGTNIAGQQGGCGSMGSGCNMMPSWASGCNMLPSWGAGCQRLGCGLLSLLFAFALLMSLFKECNQTESSSSNDSSSENTVPPDTVTVIEKDTVEVEKVVVDTLFAVDTVRLTDTTTQIIKDVLPVTPVLFKTNSAIIRNSSVPGLKKMGGFLNKHPELNMIIAGHTDASGNDRHNDTLSFCRAKAVMNLLLDTCKISSERLQFEGYGEKCPMEDNETREGRTTNRRVEFRYVGETTPCEEFKVNINENVCSTNRFETGVEEKLNQTIEKKVLGQLKTEKNLIEFIFLHEKPKSTSKRIFHIKPEDKFEILEQGEKWTLVFINGKKGYLKSNKINILVE